MQIIRSSIGHMSLENDAFSIPRLKWCDILAQDPQSDVLALAQIFKVHNRLHKHPLPLLIQKRQHETILQMSSENTDSCVLLRTHIFICMQCNTVYCNAKKDMRYHFQHKAICTHCLQSNFVVQIQTLGYLTQVNNHYYYFCEFCCGVHLWQSRGNEFCCCTATNMEAKTPKHCAVCYRTMNLFTVNLLDRKLGIIQQFMLCNKHMPSQVKLPYAYDLISLRHLIEFDT